MTNESELNSRLAQPAPPRRDALADVPQADQDSAEQARHEIDVVLDLLLSKTKDIMGERFVGMYVFGSLASGDFNPESSDVDFVVVSDTDLTQETTAKLEAMSRDLVSNGSEWARRLEGSFLPLQAFRGSSPNHAMYPSISVGGSFGPDSKGIEEPIQRSMLREDGIALVGPSPKSFIDPVTPEDLRTATLDILHGWWEPQLTDPFRLKDREYQAYAVLTMCRMLYTLTNGVIASKPASAAWATNHLDPKWKPLIERASSWRPDDRVDDLGQSLELIRYALSSESSFSEHDQSSHHRSHDDSPNKNPSARS